MRNLITDIPGLRVGNATDANLKSGTTALTCDWPMVASCAILGGAPGTRDTELLNPDQTVEAIDGLVLSGGSAFGLDACGGVQAFLKNQGRGFKIGPATVPIVPGAILFDLINGGNKDWGTMSPYWELGWQAAQDASETFGLGSHGAGTGALTAGLKGGLGSASLQTGQGITIGALVAVNALGRATMGDGPHFWAAPFEQNAEFGGLGLPAKVAHDIDSPITKMSVMEQMGDGTAANTTIGIIATDAKLTKAQAKRLAIMAHDGFTRALWPSHTPMDGDLVFALSNGQKEMPSEPDAFITLGALSAATMARAIARAVYEAKTAPGDLFPTWQERFAKTFPK